MLALQILVDGFATSTLYGLGAVGFSLIFGVAGVLNLSHGSIMVVAAWTAWVVAGIPGLGPWLATLAGTIAGLVSALVTSLRSPIDSAFASDTRG